MAVVIRPLLLAGALLLAGCDQRHGADGYEFAEPEFERRDIALQVVMHTDLNALRQAFPGKPEDGRELMAWGRVSSEGNRCEVHIVDARKLYAPEWMGHELAHCIYGRWHP